MNNVDQANYNYNIYLPTGQNLNDYWLANMKGKGANTQAQGFQDLAVWLAPRMSSYEAITPGDQGLGQIQN